MNKTKKYSQSCLLLIVAIVLQLLDATKAGGSVRRSSSSNGCPKVNAVEGFDIDEYVSKVWYVQEQLINAYQPEENLFCVRANYTKTSDTTLEVRNFARAGSVRGEAVGGDMVLSAFIPDTDVPAKLKVGPSFIPRALYGDYWIVAQDRDNKSWAIISGGQPTIEISPGLCSTESANNIRQQGGLWLFTRERKVSKEIVDLMKKKANDLGIDTTQLKKVVQSDECE